MKLYQVEAVVLGLKTMREADKIITIFSREYGKQRVVAHGASKATSRKRGAVQPLCHSRMLLYRGRELDSVSQCDGITFFTELRGNLEKLTLALYLCELVDGLSAEYQQNEPLFVLLLTTLGWLNRPFIDLPRAEKMVAGFELKMMGLMGYLPELGCCVNCGAGIKGNKITFSVKNGGVMCENCRGTDPQALAINEQTLHLMRRLLVTRPGGLPEIEMPPVIFNQLKRVLRSLTRHYLERRAKSLDFLEFLHKKPLWRGKY
ncbi:DNA repair protein RecO (recombination protein O) [Desulfohalotomaculum tongense]|uniref:DNA repair protein RecO n=1 Tax=Desulforadius tongensis TaxID=1216062 RepID=UPI001957299F|nr:DNA repair protein RecO [Desulforadius tongensis]MBM7855796.1 DNA repair protein RecO (recombination protein O) [Desulforadius tongensis]